MQTNYRALLGAPGTIYVYNRFLENGSNDLDKIHGLWGFWVDNSTCHGLIFGQVVFDEFLVNSNNYSQVVASIRMYNYIFIQFPFNN